jgi:glucose-6-phosphate-specific signal transduction histidine kinase
LEPTGSTVTIRGMKASSGRRGVCLWIAIALLWVSGFDPSGVAHETGMQGMADRLDAIGGKLEVEAAPGSGPIVRGRIPTGRPA